MGYYKMFMHVFNLFMNCTKSTGDRIDYGQRYYEIHCVLTLLLM